MELSSQINVTAQRKRAKAGKRRNSTEADLQRTVAGFLNVSLPKAAVWFSVPNGGTRNPREVVSLKAQGLKPGIPDLMVLWDSRAFAIELKRENGELHPDQRHMHSCFQDARVPVIVARSVLEVEVFLRFHGMPLKASVWCA